MDQKWLDKSIPLQDLPGLYHDFAHKWLLLEILDRNGNGNPKLLRLISFAEEKEKLRDYVMEDEKWDWGKRYVMVFADPEQPCDIR
ncbi:MAG TPA: hypothetical protein VI958_07770 [Acidobacteriota bacterium]